MNSFLQPSTKNQRIITLDIIRGFALLGILLVNVAFFHSPKFFMIGSEFAVVTDFSDKVAKLFVTIFVTGKFFTIFSFLFGLGFFIFMERTLEKNKAGTSLFLKRMLFLLMLGIVHGIFIWSGDILLPYALAGFFLLLFRNRQKETIKKWAIGLFSVSLVVIAALTFVTTLVDQWMDGSKAYYDQLIQQASIIYKTGTITQIIEFRMAEEVPLILINLLIVVPVVLSVFLFGLYVGKKGVLTNLSEHLDWIHSVWRKSFVSFVVLTILFLLLSLEVVVIPFLLHEAFLEVVGYVTGLIGSFFYMTSLTLLCQKEKWIRFLMYLAPVGQMALSNYLLQTLVCIVIFYSIGFGLYGDVSLTGGVFIAFFIFIVQIFSSHFWMRFFYYGPLEWVWRCFTYSEHVKLRK